MQHAGTIETSTPIETTGASEPIDVPTNTEVTRRVGSSGRKRSRRDGLTGGAVAPRYRRSRGRER